MATLFDTQERIFPTWLAACRALFDQGGKRQLFNLVLDIDQPLVFTEEDNVALRGVDQLVRSVGHANPLRTVANTIFPHGQYVKNGRPAFYRNYEAAEKQMRVGRQTWGTYFQRMIHPDRNTSYDPGANQLEKLIRKFSAVIDGSVNRKTAVFELNVTGDAYLGEMSAIEDVCDVGGEVATYSPARDGCKYGNLPCLSHVSFNLDSEDRLHMSAMYRSHYYGSRALGNLIGLAELLSFLADESGATVGRLTCLSTFATFDPQPFGGAKAAKEFFGW